MYIARWAPSLMCIICCERRAQADLSLDSLLLCGERGSSAASSPQLPTQAFSYSSAIL